MRVLGVDPSGSHVGLALVCDGDLVCMETVRCLPKEPERSYDERVRPAMERMSPGRNGLVAIERPPAASTAKHGSQANIGYSIGYMSGLIASPWGPQVRRVEVPFWRDAMFVYAARRGLLLQKPPRQPPVVGPIRSKVADVSRAGQGFVVTWRGCGHCTTYPSYAALIERPAACRACSSIAQTGQLTGDDWRRDEWKRRACTATKRFWPDLYSSVVLDAQSRAKTSRQDHRLVGVSDACEAAWIAMSVHSCEHFVAPG